MRTVKTALSPLTTSICCHRFHKNSKNQHFLWWHTFGCWHKRILLPKVAYFKFVQICKDWYLKFKDSIIYPLGSKFEKLEISKLSQILKVLQQFNISSWSTTLCCVESNILDLSKERIIMVDANKFGVYQSTSKYFGFVAQFNIFLQQQKKIFFFSNKFIYSMVMMEHWDETNIQISVGTNSNHCYAGLFSEHKMWNRSVPHFAKLPAFTRCGRVVAHVHM